jgi:hypothetical protein
LNLLTTNSELLYEYVVNMRRHRTIRLTIKGIVTSGMQSITALFTNFPRRTTIGQLPKLTILVLIYIAAPAILADVPQAQGFCRYGSKLVSVAIISVKGLLIVDISPSFPSDFLTVGFPLKVDDLFHGIKSDPGKTPRGNRPLCAVISHIFSFLSSWESKNLM